MQVRGSHNPALFAAVLGGYFALGEAAFAMGGAGPAAVWPASGFAVAIMVLAGSSIWPAIFVGAAAVWAAHTGELGASVTVALGNTIEAAAVAVFVGRFAGGSSAFASPSTIFRFVAIAALVGAPIGATGTVAGAMVAAPSPLADAGYLWVASWLTHLAGIVVVAPFVLLWTTLPRTRVPWHELLEASAETALLVAVGLVVFAGRFPSDVKDYPLEFLCVPFLLWTAFRLGRRQMATTVLILSSITAWGTLRGFGPFARDSRSEAIILVHCYLGLMAVMGVVLAAAVADHKHAEAQLRALATTDPLTGLANYRRLIEVMRVEIARSGRTSRPFALLLVDVNGLKRINDRHGHLVGSRAICRVADAIRRSCRAIDTPARFGGDEFAVILPETGGEGADAVLARVSGRLAHDADKPAVSVSAGAAVYPRDGDSPTLLLRMADTALYEAKARGMAARKAAAARPPEGRTGTLF